MSLTGKNFVAGKRSLDTEMVFYAYDPRQGAYLEPQFYEASLQEADRALREARRAFDSMKGIEPGARAQFLRRSAEEILGLEDVLIDRAMKETGLPEGRLKGERQRTVNQIRLFAQVIEEGSWVEARIDRAQPGRAPVPKPDVRRMLIPIGPVVVFGASNFPLAFSVMGGDTVSALAAGNPVIVKAHPSHPGTSELVAQAVIRAAERSGMPEGIFSMLHGIRNDLGLHLVRHSITRAAGFTGSLQGGRALFDAAAARPNPIPVYAEMGSINPVFLLPGALKSRSREIAAELHQSVTLGVGQFCTNPGLIVGLECEGWEELRSELARLLAQSRPESMLNDRLQKGFKEGVENFASKQGVEILARSAEEPDASKTQVSAVLFGADVSSFLRDAELSKEVFGPSTLLVTARSEEELGKVALRLEGHLTATIHASEEDLDLYGALVPILEDRVGRLIRNGYPTGVEVCHAMHHGGPYPATTDVRSTSVGTAAIQRFARPICYQDFPEDRLPRELRDANPGKIWRLIDGSWTRESIEDLRVAGPAS